MKKYTKIKLSPVDKLYLKYLKISKGYNTANVKAALQRTLDILDLTSTVN